MARTDVLVGITIGDPAGIGPEVALRAAAELHGEPVIPVIIGRLEVLRRYYGSLAEHEKVEVKLSGHSAR